MYALFFIFLTNPLFAHGGGLNKVGCHNKRKTGDYHCHRGPKASSKRPVTSRQEMLTGIPIVINGDTIRIGNTRIRLYGIDAPEVRQDCTIVAKFGVVAKKQKISLIKLLRRN